MNWQDFSLKIWHKPLFKKGKIVYLKLSGVRYKVQGNRYKTYEPGDRESQNGEHSPTIMAGPI
jgi:hypothetical protein